MTNFQSVLDRPVSQVESPKPLPPGTYLCVVKGMPRYDKSSKQGTKFIEFSLVPQSAFDDVDEEALAEALTNAATGERKPLSSFTLKNTIYYERANGEVLEYGLPQIKEFCKNCGLDTDGNAKLGALCEETVNAQIAVTLKHEPIQGRSDVRATIASTAPAE